MLGKPFLPKFFSILYQRNSVGVTLMVRFKHFSHKIGVMYNIAKLNLFESLLLFEFSVSNLYSH